MMVGIFDYQVGNLHSLTKAVIAAGATPLVTSDVAEAIHTEALILPGVGAWEPAAEHFARERELLARQIRDGLPTLGICLGMQLLFETSDEGPGQGLGVFSGRVERLKARSVPQIGWNSLDDCTETLATESDLQDVYYAHSFVCRATPGVVQAWSEHEGDRFPAIVRRGHTVGVQFHPEKSSRPGVRFIQAFLEEAAS